MNPQSPYFIGGKARFVTCARRRVMVKPLLVHRYSTMCGSKVLISPAVFKPGKPQASRLRCHETPTPAGKFNIKCSEICRGKISQQKIKPTSMKGRHWRHN
jgi:hypothetical protein